MKYKVPPVTGLAEAAAFAPEPEASVTPRASAMTAVDARMRRLVFKPDMCPPCRSGTDSRP